MSNDTLPVLLMIVAFFLTFLMPVRGVSLLGRQASLHRREAVARRSTL
ncbi:hypothetical protein [Brevundimonas sp.]